MTCLDVPLPCLVQSIVQTSEQVFVVNTCSSLERSPVVSHRLSPDPHDVEVVGYSCVKVAPHQLHNTAKVVDTWCSMGTHKPA